MNVLSQEIYWLFDQGVGEYDYLTATNRILASWLRTISVRMNLYGVPGSSSLGRELGLYLLDWRAADLMHALFDL